jgi:hypothetical protein
MSKSLIFLQLNEINFDIVKIYLKIHPKRFFNFRKILNFKNIATSAEINYKELEPWIQWASINIGKDYKSHKIYRLGDISHSNEVQFFEKIESLGFRVGAICPINASNKLKSPSYFIPDPWTLTPADDSWWSKNLTKAIIQAVNDNSQSKISLRSILILCLGIINFIQIKNLKLYIKLLFKSYYSPWCKALFLDLFLSDLHLALNKKKLPNFTILFLNAGAHIQHHYFFNFHGIKYNLKNPIWYVDHKKDPFLDLLEVYDLVIGDHLKLKGEKIIATGLSQKPYDKIKYYYRLKQHAKFLGKLGIKFNSVHPRMTRDFLVTFNSNLDTLHAEKLLNQIKIIKSKYKLFGAIENRGLSLFVTLTYPEEITLETHFLLNGNKFNLFSEVTFVAIKNGMHQGKGFAFFTKKIEKFAPRNNKHVKELHYAILNFFQC